MEVRLDHAQGQDGGHDALLHAVVQGALHPSRFPITGLDDPLACLTQRRLIGQQFGGEALAAPRPYAP
ncbi:MAG: hypothetical protein H0V67_06475 [Geodermatophilaceae bacterium]|nr:hypothetical protein [Geodermatophilaceae bacterium]